MGYEQNTRSGLEQVAYASMEQAKQTAAGVQLGAQNLVASSVFGAQQMVADLGALMPSSPLPNMHPFMAVRHGMYAHEMSLTGDLKAMFGRGAPDTTSLYEYTELAARDFGQRITNATAATGMYGAGMIGGTLLSGSMFTTGGKAGFKTGRAIAKARKMGMISGAAMGGAGALVGALPAIGAYMAVDATVGKIMDDVADRQDVMNFLEASSFRYMQGRGEDIDERMGAGFNRGARARIAESIKKIDLQDPRYNMEDLKGILEKGTELGMFSGTRDAEDFSQKFKDLTTNLKNVTKILHQSLNDGMETLKSLKEIGVTGTAGVSAAIQHADVLGTATGKTAAEMLSIGRQGAEMVRGTGVSMATGSTMMQQTFGMMGASADAGTLDPEMVRQGGGVGALSQRVMARHMQNLNTNLGKGALLSILGQDGQIDVSKLDRLASGQMTMGQMYRGATSNVSSPSEYVNAVINREKNLRDLGEQYGGMGITMTSMGLEIGQAKEAARFTGASVRDTLKFLAMQKGESEADVEARLKMLEDVDVYAEKQQAGIEFQRRKARGESLREMTDFGALLGDKFDRMINPVSTRVGRAIDYVSEGVSDAYRKTTDTILETLTGVETVQANKISGSNLADLFIGDQLEMKADPQRRVLETLTYSDADLKKFEEKSEAYKRFDKDFATKSQTTNMFTAINKGVEGFSEAVFGQAYDTLSTDEKMFLESKARQYAPEMAADLKQKRLEAQKTLRDQLAIRISQSQEDTEENKELLEDTREEMEDLFFSAGPVVEGMIDDIYDDADKDPKSARNLDDIFINTNEENKLKASIAEEEKKPEGQRNTTAISKMKERLKTAQSKKAKALMELGEKMKDPEKMAALTKGIEGLSAEGAWSSEKFEKISGKLAGSRLLVDMATKGDMAAQLQESLKQRFSMISKDVKEKLIGTGSSDMRENLSGYLEDIAQGRELSEDDIEELGEIAKKSKSAELQSVVSRVMDIKSAADKGRLGDVDKLEKFMTERNMIPKDVLDNPEQKSKLLNKFFDKGKIDAEKVIQWEMIESKTDKQDGIRFSGGRTDERVLESEMVTLQGLSKVQQDTTNVIIQLKKLAFELERRTGKRQ